MPQRKNPESLVELCKCFINNYIRRVVVFVQKKHGEESLTTNTKLKLVQDYLCSSLFPSMIDHLLKSLDVKYCSEAIKLMFLKIYMHPNMVQFQPNFRLPNQDSFYELQLIDLKKIVVLNLRMVCTDEILEVVGKNCPQLEIVDIVSKIGSERTNKLNALKLKFYVSDEGLKHLEKCQNLRRISMNTVIRSNCGGRKITHDGIRSLLKSLPKLQYINYSDMGMVLSHFNSSLNLLQLHDNHTDPHHIESFGQNCPKLQHLCLVLPTTNCDDNLPLNCLESLRKSQLNLTSLSLGMFPVDNCFKSYLKAKGSFLTSLYLVHKSTITMDVILSISQYCPNMKHLEVCRLLSGKEQASNCAFTNLEVLKIIGTCYDPNLIFQVCLFKSIHLREVVLVNEHSQKPVDDLLTHLMTQNSLNCLQKASILNGFNATLDTLVKFVLHCDNLIDLRLSNGTYEEYLNTIREEHNLHLNISTESLRNFGECLC